MQQEKTKTHREDIKCLPEDFDLIVNIGELMELSFLEKYRVSEPYPSYYLSLLNRIFKKINENLKIISLRFFI